MSRISRAIREMTGKGDGWWTRSLSGLFTDTETVDYTRNDYDLFQSIYWASEVPSGDKHNKVGKDYILAASLAKPIINSATAFAMGNGYTVELSSDTSTPEQLKAGKESLNKWLNNNQSILFDHTRLGYRDGDSYLYISDTLDSSMLDPRTVEVILDAMTGDVIGYDVSESLDEIDGNETTEMTYLKKYRKSRTDIYRYKSSEGLDTAELWHSEVYTSEGTLVIVSSGIEAVEVNDQGEIAFTGLPVERPLPIIALHNDVEPRTVYGNSELQNILIHMKNYTAIMNEGTKNVIYNNSPIPVLKGANKEDLEEDDGEGGKKVVWNKDTILFLEGDSADAKFLATSNIMDDTSKLMEYYFYLILQGSETPEFVFGAAVSSSKASVSEQMPVVAMKAERKRTQLVKPILNMIDVLIDRSIWLSNPDFLPFEDNTPEVKVIFPPIIDDDKNLTKDTIEMLLAQGVISNKTALELTIGERIGDIDEEVANAKEDAQSALAGIVPYEANRLEEEPKEKE